MSKSEDPWAELAPPRARDTLSARRVAEANMWDFFWGLDRDANCLLLLRFEGASAPSGRLPRLRGVEVLVSNMDDDRPALLLRLLDHTLRDLFFRLCVDIIESTSRASSEREAVATALGRTWRWHHLLRGGGGGLLSQDEQKGLLGELFVLERYFVPALAPDVAVRAWRGPLGEAQDFVIGRTAIESKAHGRNASSVWINSEFQLDDASLDALFLHLSAFDLAELDADDGFSLTDVVQRIRPRLQADIRALERYNALLAAAGFSDDDDYSEVRWIGGERSLYRVGPSFPRITAPRLPGGISDVRYTLSLVECAEFLDTPAALEQVLQRQGA